VVGWDYPTTNKEKKQINKQLLDGLL